MELHIHTHLFSRVLKLEIPDTLCGYLLYDQKLDDTKYMKILSSDDVEDFEDDDEDLKKKKKKMMMMTMAMMMV